MLASCGYAVALLSPIGMSGQSRFLVDESNAPFGDVGVRRSKDQCILSDCLL